MAKRAADDEDDIHPRLATECWSAVRQAAPKDLNEARAVARREYVARGVANPSVKAVEDAAHFAMSRHPLSLLLQKLGRGYVEIFKILKATSQPSWLNAPNSAVHIDSLADDEFLIYPEVFYEVAAPIFERIRTELTASEDKYDSIGTVTARSFSAWLSVDPRDPNVVLVNVAKTVVGRLDGLDVQRLRTTPDPWIPGPNQTVSVQGELIETDDPHRPQLALWFPFPSNPRG